MKAKQITADPSNAYANVTTILSTWQGLTVAVSTTMRADLLSGRCEAFARMDKFAEALEDSTERRRLRPMSARSFECQSTALLGLGREVEAMDAMKVQP